MATQTKRATIYFDPNLHKALRLKAVETSRSVSDLVNEAVRDALSEDAEDLLNIGGGISLVIAALSFFILISRKYGKHPESGDD